jgi:hypothetical protein
VNILPRTKQEWFGFAMFPFKAFAVIAPIWVIVLSRQSYYLREAVFNGAVGYTFFWGDALGVAAFIVAAIFQLFSGQRRRALTSMLIAAAAIAIGWFLLVPLYGLARA